MFSLRYALASLTRRIGRSAFLVVVSATVFALFLVVTGTGDALIGAEDRALTPLRTAQIDLTVTSGSPVELARESGAVRVDPVGLVPGERFVRDEFLLGGYWPIAENAIRVVASDSHVVSSSEVLLLPVSRVTGVAPKAVVVPRLTVAPLTPEEEAEIERKIIQDAAYQAAERELFDLRERQRRGEPVSEARKAQLARRLVELEFAYYPPRFQGIAAEKIAPDPVNAEASAFLVAGIAARNGAEGPLREADITSGSYFARDASRTVVLESSFAKTSGLVVGDVFSLKGVDHAIVGLASPPPGLISAHVFMPIEQLRSLAHVEGCNMALVRADGPSAVEGLIERISDADKDARVVDSAKVSGSLVGGLSALRALLMRYSAAVYFLVGFVTLGAVLLAAANAFAARRRELWTLSAIGWPRRRIAAAIAVEALVLGVLGAVLGVSTAHVVAVLAGSLGWFADVAVGGLDAGLSGTAPSVVSITLVPELPVERSATWAGALVLAVFIGALAAARCRKPMGSRLG